MNSYQIKSIARAIESIAYHNGTLAKRHKLDEWERGFIRRLSKKSAGYELTEKENHKLNMMRGKI